MADPDFGGLRNQLRDASKVLNDLQAARSKRERRTLAFVLFLLSTGGAALAGFAQFLAIQAGDELGPWNVAGMIGALLIFLGGFVALVSAWNRDDELTAAQRATSLAQLYDDMARDFEFVLRQLDRAAELFRSMEIMRTMIQFFHELGVDDDEDRVRILLDAVEPTMLLAFDFEVGEHWTLGVYKAEPDPECCELLRCVATVRSTRSTNPGTARRWPTGVGFAGIVHARGSELMLADLADKALGNLDELPSNLVRESDRSHYRSVAAVPVLIRNVGWGVAVATSDRPGRFDVEDEAGVRGAEAVRALAGMVALAVSQVHKPRPTPRASVNPAPKPKPGRPPRKRKSVVSPTS